MRQVPTALLDITPEQREIYRQKAAAKREADKVFALEHLRNDFADKNHWRRLASHYGVISFSKDLVLLVRGCQG